MDFTDKYLDGCSLLNNGQFNKAIKIFEEILSSDPQHYESINKIGVAFARQNRLDDALEMFNKCICLKPDFAPAIVNAGNVYKQRSCNDEALSLYMRAIEVDENYYLAYYNLAAAHKSLGNYDEYFKNIKEYKRLLKQHINSTEKYKASKVNKKSIYLAALGIAIIIIFLAIASRGV